MRNLRLCRRVGVAFWLGAALVGCASSPGQDKAEGVVAAAQIPPDLLRLAQMSLDEGAFEDARKRFSRILAVDPANKEAKLGVAESLLALGDAAGARSFFDELAADPVYGSRAMAGQGLCAAARRDDDNAERLLRRAVAADPKLWRAWNGLGRVYDGRKNWKEAAAAYEKARELVPDSPVVNNNLGYSLMLQGKSDEAVRHFLAALQRDGHLEVAQNNLRLALAWQGRYDDAETGATRDNLPKVLNNLGYVAMARGDYDKAEGLLTLAIERSPNYYDLAWQNMARLKALHPEQTAVAK